MKPQLPPPRGAASSIRLRLAALRRLARRVAASVVAAEPAASSAARVVLPPDALAPDVASQALRACEERLQRVLAASQLALWDFDGSTGVFELAGSSLSDGATLMSAATLAERIHRDDLPALRAAFIAALKGPDASFRTEYRLRRDDGSWCWKLSEAQVVERDGAGRALRMVGTSRDISERRQGEALLLGQKQVLALIADGTPLQDVLAALMRFVEAQSPGMLCSVLLLDADGLHLTHGAAPSLPPAYAQAIDGVTIGPSVGSCGTAAFRREAVIVEDIATDPLWADFRELALGHGLRSCWSTPIPDARGRVLGTFAMYYHQPCRPSAGHLWLIDVATQTAAIAIQHHAVDATLRKSVLALENTFEHIEQGISITDKDLYMIGTNRRFRELLDLPEHLCRSGTPSEAVFRYNALRGDYGPGDVEEQVRSRVEKARRREPHRFERERPDGSILEIRGTPLPEGGFVTTYADITQRARSERDLLRFRAALNLCPDAVYLIDCNTLTILDCNDGTCRMLGYPREELVGYGVERMSADRSREDIAALYARVARGEPASEAETQIVARRKDGSTLPVEISRRVLQTADGPVLVAIARDLTERKQAEAAHAALEAQLRESQKMEAIGTLAGGIAHDFNNILGAILGNTALAREELGSTHPALASVEQVHRAGLRARGLVQQILAFSRRQAQQLVLRALRPLVEESLTLLRATLPAGAALELQLGDEPLHVLADATQMQQVLLNLCTNAWHALPGGRGRIVVGLEPVQVEADAIGLSRGLGAGRHAHLWVSDDGCGMDAATRARIFEPFFTTKPVGQGTGLGLAVVHGIVSAHQGAISVDSELGRGSRFHLYFPLVAAGEAAAESGWGALQPQLGHGERVLYIDDDEVVALVTERLLRRAGYRVTCCTNPQEALAAVAARPEAFDLVISDFNMPGLSGLDVARQIALMRPDLPVIIGSGLITDAMRSEALAVGVRHLMRKENAHAELVPLVQQVLAEAGR